MFYLHTSRAKGSPNVRACGCRGRTVPESQGPAEAVTKLWMLVYRVAMMKCAGAALMRTSASGGKPLPLQPRGSG